MSDDLSLPQQVQELRSKLRHEEQRSAQLESQVQSLMDQLAVLRSQGALTAALMEVSKMQRELRFLLANVRSSEAESDR